MRLQRLIALAVSATAFAAMAVGISAPADAQGYHHDGYHHAFVGGHPGFGGGGGYRPAFYGGDYHHGFVGGYHGYGSHYYNHPYAAGWRPGPGYVHHSWAWYHRQPFYWRAAHPYHGSPSLGIWIRL